MSSEAAPEGAAADKRLNNLSAEVDQLGQVLDDVKAAVETLKEQGAQAASTDEVAELNDLVAQIGDGLNLTRTEFAEAVKVQAEAIARLEAAAPAGGGAEGEPGYELVPQSWLDVPPAQAFEVIKAVYDWGTTAGADLSPPLEVEAPCWWQHSTAVQALMDARYMWWFVYRSGKARPSDVVSWMRRDWRDFQSSISGELKNCVDDGKHVQPRDRRRWHLGTDAVLTYEKDVFDLVTGRKGPAPDPVPGASGGGGGGDDDDDDDDDDDE